MITLWASYNFATSDRLLNWRPVGFYYNSRCHTGPLGCIFPWLSQKEPSTRATIFVQGGTRTLFSKVFLCAWHCSATALYGSNANSCNSKSRFFWIILPRIQTLLGQRPFESKSGSSEIFSPFEEHSFQTRILMEHISLQLFYHMHSKTSKILTWRNFEILKSF